jgi:hypothetical protein
LTPYLTFVRSLHEVRRRSDERGTSEARDLHPTEKYRNWRQCEGSTRRRYDERDDDTAEVDDIAYPKERVIR